MTAASVRQGRDTLLIIILFMVAYLGLTSLLTWLACLIFGWVLTIWLLLFVWFGIPCVLISLVALFDDETRRTRDG